MSGNKSLAENSARKRKILIGCAVGGTAILMAGAGVGIGYVIWHDGKNMNMDQDPIIIKSHNEVNQENNVVTFKVSKGTAINWELDGADAVDPLEWSYSENEATLKLRKGAECPGYDLKISAHLSDTKAIFTKIHVLFFTTKPKAITTTSDVLDYFEHAGTSKITFGVTYGMVDSWSITENQNAILWDGNDYSQTATLSVRTEKFYDKNAVTPVGNILAQRPTVTVHFSDGTTDSTTVDIVGIVHLNTLTIGDSFGVALYHPNIDFDGATTYFNTESDNTGEALVYNDDGDTGGLKYSWDSSRKLGGCGFTGTGTASDTIAQLGDWYATGNWFHNWNTGTIISFGTGGQDAWNNNRNNQWILTYYNGGGK